MTGERGWGGGLFARPWRLVAAVALLVALPVLILGQASENDTRERVSRAQLDSAMHEADVISTSFNEREESIQATIAALALNPRPDGSPIGVAVQRGDIPTLQGLVETVQRLYPRYVLGAYIAVRGKAETINEATVVAAAPIGSGLVGQGLPAEQLIHCKRGCNNTDYFITGAVGADHPGTIDAPSVEEITATIPGPGPDVQRRTIFGLAQVVAQVDLARLFADTATPSLATGDDAYLLDGERRLIGRARGSTPFPLRDLSGDPFVQVIAPGAPALARAGMTDPLGLGRRLIVGDSVGGSNWSLLVLRDTTAFDREIGSALSQLALFRVALVALVLGFAYVIGLAGSRLGIRAADQERLRLARDLHDLLGHSLSLITIKSQLARRLLSPGEGSGAATEIADVERVARESLDDVRRAVDGYRQPSLSSALTGARAALAAAGIDSTIEMDVGPLPIEVEGALAWAIREGVTNIIRHSGATTCSICVTREDRDAVLDITDNGPLRTMSAPGSGLRGLHERAAALGGHAEADSIATGGFRLHVSLPS